MTAASGGSSKQTGQGQQIEQNSNQRKPTKAVTSGHQIGHDSSNESEVVDIVRVHSVSPDIPLTYRVLTEINEILITTELDAGAGVSIISEQNMVRQVTETRLHFYTLGFQTNPWMLWAPAQLIVYIEKQPHYH